MDRPLPRTDRPIVLVGPMGAGKTSVGRRLARRLGLPFADSDEDVAQAEGRSVAEMFDRFGEAGFRDAERMAMARLIDCGPQVIAAGGGGFVDEETRALILSRCLAIWLDADVATLAERVGSGGERPLLRGRDRRSRLEELAAHRNPIYAKAHLRVSSEGAAEDETVERIVTALCERNRA